MKNSKQILFSFLLFISILTHAQKIYVQKQSDNGVMLFGLNGDTVIVKSSLSPLSYFFLGGCKNVTVINEGGQVQLRNFDSKNCEGVTVTGSGSIDKFGFYLTEHSTEWQGRYAISVAEKSKDIHFERFKIDSVGGGIWIKNEHFCDSSLTSWVLSNMVFNDFEISNTHEHGSYIGSTEPKNETRPSYCNGDTLLFNPSHTSGIKFYNGKIWNTGKNGLMICDCRFKMCELSNLDIDSSGLQGDPAQGQGMALGGWTKARLNNVHINHSATWNLRSSGSDSVIISNSSFLNSGWENIVITKKDYQGNMYFEECNNIGEFHIDNDIAHHTCKTSILPVRLISFNAQKQGQSALLTWVADGADSFQIERSNDGNNFVSIGSTKLFHFTDNSLLPGLNFYRLKMFEGVNYSYSPVQVVINGNASLTVEVINTLGQQLQIVKTNNLQQFKTTLRPNTVYILRVFYTDNKFYIEKISKLP